MSKCKYCGFDPEEESLYAIGAPCGYKGCLTFSCCMDAWREHVKKAHPEYNPDEEVLE